MAVATPGARERAPTTSLQCSAAPILPGRIAVRPPGWLPCRDDEAGRGCGAHLASSPASAAAELRGVTRPARTRRRKGRGRSAAPCRAEALEQLLSGDLAVGDAQAGSGTQQSAADRFWGWRGQSIRYQAAGTQGPSIVLVHGFGANCDHWRKNIGALGQTHRVYALDLLGYGYSSKPNPAIPVPNLPLESPYKFETWGAQISDFISEVVGEPAFVACNSVGGVAGLQAAVDNPSLVRGIVLLNISLRLLHVSKQSWASRPAVAALQWTLRNTGLGKVFFSSVATPKSVKNILQQCYADPATVTDELVEVILKPGLEPGAVDVFLDFICYSGGPLPEELIPRVQCPVAIGWGEKDPWEPLSLGKDLGKLDTVTEFKVFPGVGHCPQDEAPQLVNPFITSFVAEHS